MFAFKMIPSAVLVVIALAFLSIGGFAFSFGSDVLFEGGRELKTYGACITGFFLILFALLLGFKVWDRIYQQ